MLRILALFLLFATAAANADLSDDLKTCAELVDAESRLACFDAIGREALAPSERDSAVESVAAPESMAPVPEPPEPAAPLESVQGSDLDAVSEREREAIERAAKQDADQAAAIAEQERKKLEQAAREAEQQAEREQVVFATITNVVRHNDRRFSVTLDNGQVWRESQGSRVGVPEEGASVELKRGRFGGYRMKIEGLSRVAWVKRTR